MAVMRLGNWEHLTLWTSYSEALIFLNITDVAPRSIESAEDVGYPPIIEDK